MRNVRGTRHSLPNTRTLTVIAQDPSVKFREQVLTTRLTVPAEELLAGPCGYRVNVIDYDASTGTLYKPMSYGRSLDDTRVRSRSNKAAAPRCRRGDFVTGDFCRILGFMPRTCTRLRCARWHNSNSRSGAGAPGVSADIRFTSSRTHSPMPMRFIRGTTGRSFLAISWEVTGSLSSPVSRMTSSHRNDARAA